MTSSSERTTVVSTATASLSKRRPLLVAQESAEVSPSVDLSRKRHTSDSTIAEEPLLEEHANDQKIGWRPALEKYLELEWTEDLANDEGPADSVLDSEEGIDRIVRSTLKLERLLWFGVALCLDQILSCLTTLPLRICYGILGMRKISSKFIFDAACFSIVVLAVGFLVSFVGAAQVYHSIRLQTFMKLYVVVNIAEVLDRLLSSLGLDLFELLADASVLKHRGISFAVRYVLCLGYTCIHALLFYVRLLTLSVAVNSSNDALFTILVSNNFVELKGSVFKRSTEQNLFQISCSDVVERFVLIVFMLLVGLNEYETRKMNAGDHGDFFALMCLVLVVELIVDWIKHMFIVRFNSDIKIKDAYDRFLGVVADDYRGKTPVEDVRGPNIFPAVARRLGLPIIPLTTVIVRVFVFDVSDVLHERSWLFVASGWAICLAVKTILRYILHSWSAFIAEASVILLTDDEKTPPVTPKTPPVTPAPLNLATAIATISAEKPPMSNTLPRDGQIDSAKATKSSIKWGSQKKTPQLVLAKVSRFENG
jgi:hypothetical protein